jgi:hypothetical protein
VRYPTDVPRPVEDRAATVLHVTLTAEEVIGRLDPSVASSYRYWVRLSSNKPKFGNGGDCCSRRR